MRAHDSQRASAAFEVAGPKKQHAWGLPAIALFVLGGAASGMYILSFLTGMLRSGTPGTSQVAVIKLLPPMLACLGFFLITLEAGRPLRGIYLFRRPQSSWMSREILAGTVFIVCSLLEWRIPSAGLQTLSAGAASVLMISQAFILYDAKAIRAWNNSFTLMRSLMSSICLGAGLLLTVTAIAGKVPAGLLLVITLVALSLDLLARYFGTRQIYENNEPGMVKNRRSSFRLTAVGHLVPMLILPIIHLGRDVSSSAALSVLSGAAGALVVIGGINVKKTLIRDAGHFRKILLTEGGHEPIH